MPAARKPGEPNDLVASLHARALRQPVNNTITMARYYRSLDLLLGQVRVSRCRVVCEASVVHCRVLA